MFDFIKGSIVNIEAKNIVIENNDIGYIIHVTNPFTYKVNNRVCIYIYTYIRDDAFDLYGFNTIKERDLFIKLISVKGIGPKGALAILASGEINRLEMAIQNGEAKYLQKFPGIGPKASGQIILDLKGKLVSITDDNPKVQSVKEALRSLGYNNNELKKIDSYLIENIDLDISELVKMSLKRML